MSQISEREREALGKMTRILVNTNLSAETAGEFISLAQQFADARADAREAAVREELGEVLAEGWWTISRFDGARTAYNGPWDEHDGAETVRARLVAVKGE